MEQSCFVRVAEATDRCKRSQQSWPPRHKGCGRRERESATYSIVQIKPLAPRSFIKLARNSPTFPSNSLPAGLPQSREAADAANPDITTIVRWLANEQPAGVEDAAGECG